MKHWLGKLVPGLTLALLPLFVSSFAVAADSPATPAAPTSLSMMRVKGAGLLPTGGWVHHAAILLRFQSAVSGDTVTPQVEVRRSTDPFNGQPNFAGPPLRGGGLAVVKATALKNGTTYHWQARFVGSSSLPSPWVNFAPQGTSGFDFGVDRNAPSRPVVTSSTNPKENRWYHNQIVRLRWNSSDTISGIAGYSYLLERRAHVIPPGSITSQSSLRLTNLPDGVWYLALRSVDRAGNWSPTATFRLQLDRQAPHVSLTPTKFTFNPYRGPTSLRVWATKDANVQLALYRVGDRNATQTYSAHLRGRQISAITWSGKDSRGRPVPRGSYFFSVRASDRANNVTRSDLGAIYVDPEQPHRAATGQLLFAGEGKRIIVSLSHQTLYAYDGARLLLQTYVTTGNGNLPTPPGSYSIMAKYHPFEFISPWPPGSRFWYPPSLSQYAMLFRSGGYFLHDAPWRSVFGPGSNGGGVPGTNFGGTHGCVNIPPGPTFFLWNWAAVGTRVLVVP